MRLESDIPEYFEFLKDVGYSNDQKAVFYWGVFLVISKTLLHVLMDPVLDNRGRNHFQPLLPLCCV